MKIVQSYSFVKIKLLDCNRKVFQVKNKWKTAMGQTMRGENLKMKSFTGSFRVDSSTVLTFK